MVPKIKFCMMRPQYCADLVLVVSPQSGDEDTHNARTLIPMNTCTQTLPLGASSKTVLANPQDCILRNSFPREVEPRT
jgi:hypothetical protein